MTNGYVTIGTHNEEKDTAGELIYTRRCHIDLTHYFPKYPASRAHCRYEKRYTNQETLIRYSKVNDIHVRYRLHL